MARTQDTKARASKGGLARAKAMTAEQRSESARKAVQARWRKNLASSVSIHSFFGRPLEKAVIQVEMNYARHEIEPEIQFGGESWSASSPLSVITQIKVQSLPR